MRTTDINLASTSIARLLIGLSLDSFRVHSSILLLGFYRPEANDELPGEVWISCSGTVQIINPESNEHASDKLDADFFVRRASILGKIYHLIGATIHGAGIEPAGALTISLQAASIRFERDDSSFEEVWTVMSDSPDVSDAHCWYIALEDSGEVGATIPDR